MRPLPQQQRTAKSYLLERRQQQHGRTAHTGRRRGNRGKDPKAEAARVLPSRYSHVPIIRQGRQSRCPGQSLNIRSRPRVSARIVGFLSGFYFICLDSRWCFTLFFCSSEGREGGGGKWATARSHTCLSRRVKMEWPSPPQAPLHTWCIPTCFRHSHSHPKQSTSRQHRQSPDRDRPLTVPFSANRLCRPSDAQMA